MKRIFIAVKIDPGKNLLRIYSSLKSGLSGERISWTDPANIHLTLAFLGDTEEDMIKVASIVLRQRCNGFGDSSFTIKEAGVFKNYRDPRVIWIGIDQNEKLIQLNDQITTGLKDAGFKLEERRFTPHITLGRIKTVRNPDHLRLTIEKYKDADIQEIHVKEVVIFESILKPAGPIYKPVGKFLL